MLKLSKIMVLSLLVVALAIPAMATTSRVGALAGSSNYINDDSDIFRWYGTLPSYSNMVMAEAGMATDGIGPSGLGDLSTDYQALGFTHSWGEDHWLGTWAVFLLMNSIEDMSFFAFNPLNTPGGGPTFSLAVPSTKFVFAWGNDVDVLSYGINFTRSDYNLEATSGSGDYSYTTVGGGVRVDVGDAAYFDAAVTYGKAGGDTLGGFENGNAFNLEGRLFWEMRDDVTVVPYVGWESSDYASENAAASSGDKMTDFSAGASLNMDVNTNNMLVFATEISFMKWEPSKVATGDQSEVNMRTLPKFYVALESDINSWLTTRVGATKTMTRVESKDSAGDETVTTGSTSPGDDFSWTLGAGFHIGEWDIDAMFSHELPFRMGYWITGYGAGDTDAPVSRVSATYRF